MWNHLVVSGPESGGSVPLSDSSLKCAIVIIQPLTTNLTDIKIGGSSVNEDEGFTLRVPQTNQLLDRVELRPQTIGNGIDLSELYLYSSDGSGVEILYHVI